MIVGLAEQALGQATAGHDYRLVVTPGIGCATATQFVGVIHPGRTRSHYHHYDEVLYVLEGRGVLHIEGEEDPDPSGRRLASTSRHASCTRSRAAAMRACGCSGVFSPAGSPAEAYYPDGTLTTLR